MADLQSDIHNDETLTAEQKKQTTVSTLHRIARGIVETNHGTRDWPYQPHFKIIGQFWKQVVWADVLAFHPDNDREGYGWKSFENQLHNDAFDQSFHWPTVKQTYFGLCEFYNAAGFADIIIRARIALEECPQLKENEYFIIDEYQDFNAAEEAFIDTLTGGATGVLIAGDDEQVLYETLKSGDAALIRNYYKNQDIVNAMLPFCGRCSYHITKAAAHFIQKHQDNACINKIFLPLETDQRTPKVQIIACATPVTAVDYIGKFVDDHRAELDDRREKLASGEENDAFLLILTPARELKFFRDAGKKVLELVADYRTEPRSFSEDYYKILNYYSLSAYPRNNFTFRKVLFYERVSDEQVHDYIEEAIHNSQNLCDLAHEGIKKVLEKCHAIRAIIEEEISLDDKIEKLSVHLSFAHKEQLKHDLEQHEINQESIAGLEHQEEEQAELEEIEVKKMSAIELITIVGAKGLSADHVIIIGFDDVNMSWITRNAFYVALTRARKSLHLITSLQSGGSRRAHDFLGQMPYAHMEFFSYKKSDRSTTQRTRQGFTSYLSSLTRRQNR